MPSFPARRKAPWYFLTILGFFVLPLIALGAGWVKAERKPLLISLAVIMVLGYLWSVIVSANHWWAFNPDTLLGIALLPHLPVEEALFYPLGGLLSILAYVYFQDKITAADTDRGRAWFRLGLLAGTVLALTVIALALLMKTTFPAYLLSQLLLYNALTLLLWPWVRARVRLVPSLLSTLLLALIGLGWDSLAFTLGWWEYYAIAGWRFPGRVPIDDWNFYLFAPLAAIFLYESFRGRKTS